MDKKVLVVWSCVVLVALLVSPSKGTTCTKKTMKYSSQHYCASSMLWWCTTSGYRRISVYTISTVCCPGFKGKYCTTPICQTPCKPGYNCTSPDVCTPDSSVGTMTTDSLESTVSPTTASFDKCTCPN
eukprot:XP_011433485.1 PREDICTED: uncharacterized protein LOC105332557 [Crassostrea gigas]